MSPRILVVSHLYPSKHRPTRAPWLAEQVAALADAGVQVDVLCCSPFDRSHDDSVSASVGVVPLHFRTTSAGRLNDTRPGLMISTMRYAWQASRFLRARKGRYDLLHAHFAFPDGLLACVLGRQLGIPVLVTLHGSDVARILARRSPLSRLLGAELSSASRVICVSAELEAAAKTGLPAGTPTSLIPNGFDDSLFHVADKPRDLGFLFVGAFRPVKNVQLLVETYLSTPALHGWPLTLVGGGPMDDELRRVADGARGVTVRFLGPLDRIGVADAMQRAGALVLPSQREGYGVVASEALACGTPVVASRVGGLPQILIAPPAGVLVEPGDARPLAEAMLKVMSWPHTAESVASSSGALPWGERADEIVSVYEEILGDRNAF